MTIAQLFLFCLFFILNFLSSIEAGISAEKCAEYEELSYDQQCVGLLPIDFGNNCFKKLNCDHTTPLIVGGMEARKHEFPHFALLGYQIYDDLSFHCGGSLISESFILTAAHCQSSEGVEVSVVRLGEADLSHRNDFVADYRKEKFITHPRYNSYKDINDIALIKLTENVRMSKYVRPACLHQNEREILMGKDAIAVGFGGVTYGEDSSEVLLKVNLTVVHKMKCNKAFNGTLLKSQICVKGNLSESGMFGDTCQGDSGGPISMTRVNNRCMYDLVGITSIGKLCGYNIPAVYTRISSYISWIEGVVWK